MCTLNQKSFRCNAEVMDVVISNPHVKGLTVHPYLLCAYLLTRYLRMHVMITFYFFKM